MLGIKSTWSFFKNSPRFMALIFNFITVFLTVFLLIGCYNTSNDDTFLVRYEFNSDSPMYSIIKESFATSNKTSGLEKIQIRTGYMGVCVSNVPSNYDLQGQALSTYCYARKNLTNTSLYSDLQIKFSQSSSSENSTSDQSTLNILQIAELTVVKVLHPYVLIATIILTLIMFLLIVYVILPGVPMKFQVDKFLLLLSSVIVLLWGMGAMYTHVGIRASYEFVPAASMDIIDTYRGKKSGTMSWFSFSFYLVICVIFWSLYIRERTSASKDEEILNNATNRNFHLGADNISRPYMQNHYYSSSENSSYHSKR
ncbi:hypothetical protein KAFR_0C00630 [Kazachstania africana CBS 2517]|uniref:MARVEL domain-containing protein n=1 Tax=Kazachstania africana (strain ATCC 22294 / BCRC 22015 / CBS 2517 / CECT 1963 / NBRC 1671 / NRRL Y-8276) TaxID=1071382 RepID=H2ARQ8_KAZAF|nr:hypothetical protein KAFR_0C00630 [Kazachstania africana CBS 2517]CCF57058.1 hypothetical protein KAFR_0C00630 [Kazachstania africana CBS 2517]